jgi:hypothetical protein
MVQCQGYCDTFFTDPHMRLSRVTCEVQDGTAHCQCKGYWLPWKKQDSDSDPPSDDPDDPDDPGDPGDPGDPEPGDPPDDFWP